VHALERALRISLRSVGSLMYPPHLIASVMHRAGRNPRSPSRRAVPFSSDQTATMLAERNTAFRPCRRPIPSVGQNGFCRLRADPPSDDPGMCCSCHLSRKQLAQNTPLSDRRGAGSLPLFHSKRLPELRKDADCGLNVWGRNRRPSSSETATPRRRSRHL
jgi:hypothetical protein